MISKEVKKNLESSSLIRRMFEEGLKLKKKYGEENVFDFSLGNPSLKISDELKNIIKKVADDDEHSYMPNAGYIDVRKSVADRLNNLSNSSYYDESSIVMCVGAAGGLNVVLKTIINDGDEVILLAPFFGEYLHYINNAKGKAVIIEPRDLELRPNLKSLENSINEKTRAIIVNTPNNPTGIVYSEELIKDISKILTEKSKEFNTDIYILSDEPYRELVYDGINPPFIPNYYNNTIIVYSYSKSLSLAGERIGYIAVSKYAKDYDDIVKGLIFSNRILGFVNAPALFQKVIAEFDGSLDLSYYDRNRQELMSILDEAGFDYIKPKGAFYIFLRTMIDEDAFAALAREKNILVVPGGFFHCSGYVRLSYCINYNTIKASRQRFIDLRRRIDER